MTRTFTVTEEEIGLGRSDSGAWFVVRESGIPIADFRSEQRAHKFADRLERGLPA